MAGMIVWLVHTPLTPEISGRMTAVYPNFI